MQFVGMFLKEQHLPPETGSKKRNGLDPCRYSWTRQGMLNPKRSKRMMLDNMLHYIKTSASHFK